MSLYYPNQVIEAIDYLRKQRKTTELSNESLKDIYIKIILPLSDINQKKIEEKKISEILQLFENQKLNNKSYDDLKAILNGVPYNPPSRTYLSKIIENLINLDTLKKFLPDYRTHKLTFEELDIK